jgi:tetratricopeptide (TPR) repeat protein
LEAGKNPNDAINMIIEAYQKMPYDGNIVDSIGWACYRLGLYDKAILYLEQASDMLPSNALISDHLGDAYWFGGRKNEAIFQWKHALTLKEGAEEIKRDVIENKIENSLIENKILNVDNHEIVKKLLELDSGNNSAKPTKKNAAK